MLGGLLSLSGGISSAAGPTAANFLARTSGLDPTHTNAYITLLNGLDTDGLTSKLDVLRILATQDSTTALLNLISNNFNAALHGTPTFTADRGFTGVDSSTFVYIQSNFNPTTATSPNFVQDSAHIGVWSLTNAASGASGGCAMGLTSNTAFSMLFPKYNDGNVYFRINSTNIAGVTNSDGTGFYIANRSASNAIQGYRNGSSIFTSSAASLALVNGQFIELASNNVTSGVIDTGAGIQAAAFTYGGSLSSTDVTNLYNRLRIYMTAVGVP